MVANKLIILFGLAGVGKSFVGQLLKNKFDYYFWDADDSLPKEMRDCIRARQPFTQSMRDDFAKITIQKITDLSVKHKNLVISQALYKEKNRLEIQTRFPKALFIHVQAPLSVILQRLQQRQDDVDEEYAKKIALNFEEPLLSHHMLINNADESDIVSQLKMILDESK